MAKPLCIIGDDVDPGIWSSLRKDETVQGMRRRKEPMKKWNKGGKKGIGKMLKKRVDREEVESSRGVSMERRSQKRGRIGRNVKVPVMRTFVMHTLS